MTFAFSMKSGDHLRHTVHLPPHTRFGNVYYHCSISCVRSVWPFFLPNSVIVPEYIWPRLLLDHKNMLRTTFEIVLQSFVFMYTIKLL